MESSTAQPQLYVLINNHYQLQQACVIRFAKAQTDLHSVLANPFTFFRRKSIPHGRGQCYRDLPVAYLRPYAISHITSLARSSGLGLLTQKQNKKYY